MKSAAALILGFLFFIASGVEAHAQDPDSSITMNLLWSFKTKGKIYSSACIDNGVIYFGSEDKNIYALDSKTGKQQWSFATGEPVYSSPAIDKNRLFCLSMYGYLYALNAQNGKLIWKFKTGGESKQDIWDYYLSDPVVQDRIVYFGSSDHFIYALQIDDGKLVWKFETGDMVHAKPVINKDSLFVGGFDGKMYALHAKTGKLLWTFQSVGDAYFPKGELQKGPLLFNNTLYVGSRDYNIYALDPATGRGKWNMKEQGSWVIATPFEWNNYIYFGTSDTHNFYCLDANYGGIKWKLPLNMRVYGSAVTDGSLIYFGCFNGKLYGVDPLTGKIKKSFQTDGSNQNYFTIYEKDDQFRKDFDRYGKDFELAEKKILSLGSIIATPVVQDSVIFFGSADGNFYAVKTGN